jgi:hypothetical protein
VQFSPTKTGQFTSDLIITTNVRPDSVLTFHISGNKDSISFKTSTDYIDFGILSPNEAYDSVFTIQNEGTINTTFKLSDPAEFTPDTSHFLISKGNSRQIILHFEGYPNDTIIIDTLKITDSICGYEKTLILKVKIQKDKNAPNLTIIKGIKPYYLACESSKTDTLVIKNTGGDSLRIEKAQLTNPEFSFIPEFDNFSLPPDSIYYLIIKFLPTSLEIKTTDLIISSNVKPDSVLTLHLSGKKDSVLVKTSVNQIDLGMLFVNVTKDTSFSIQNEGTVSVSGYLATSPDFISNLNTFNLSFGDNKQIQIHFYGFSKDTIIIDTIKVIDSICGYIKFIIIKVQILEPASATLLIGNIEASPGDTVELPIYLINPKNLIKSGSSGFTAGLIFNSTLLLPLEEPKGTASQGKRTVPLELPLIADTNNVIQRLKFIAALGNDTTTPLTLSNYVSVGGNVIINKIDGLFRLLGVCHEGGDRLINPEGTISITCKPNPVNDKVQFDFETIEDGYTELFISDMLGNKVVKVLESYTHGKYSIEADLSLLCRGVYAYTLQTPTARVSKLFIMNN